MFTLDQYIIDIVKHRLKIFKGNQWHAAISLGMSRGTFIKYMKLGRVSPTPAEVAKAR